MLRWPFAAEKGERDGALGAFVLDLFFLVAHDGRREAETQAFRADEKYYVGLGMRREGVEGKKRELDLE